MEHKPQLSLWEKASLVIVLLQVIGTALYAVISAPFRGENGAPTFRKHVTFTTSKAFLSLTTIRQTQAVTASTDEVYLALGKKKGFPPETITLPDGITKAHWIGSKNAERIVIWFHGGGYCLPAGPGHYAYCHEIWNQLSRPGNEAAVLVLSYSLAPQARYPAQLKQAVELVRHLINDLGRRPSTMAIAGDSAGGNLALGVFSHILHPHPAIPPLALSEPFKAAVLLAPWANFATHTSSFQRNQYKDLLGPPAANKWSSAFMGNSPPDNYNQPYLAPVEWWEGIKVEEILVVAGEQEVLLDVVQDIAKKLESAHPKTTTFIAAGEFHDEPVIGPDFGFPECESARMIKSWLAERL
ncbi:hypothetical protein MMC24_002448 [Lignoscripta atroalba]|nr:hypothetical protein [Lignoscripta atroalba]